MGIDFEVPVENLVQRLLVGHFDSVLVLGQGVDDANESGSGRQLADAVPCIVGPPRDGKGVLVPA